MKKGRFVGFYWKPVLIKGFQPDSVLSLQLRPYVEAAEKDLATVVGEATEEFSLFQDGEHNVGTNALVSLLNPELLRRIHVGIGDQGAGKGIVRFFSHLISPLSLCFSCRQHCACRL